MSVITATLEGKDSLVVQPTGTGKSMCYTLPPLYDGRTAIVISPTISLMTDQVSKLSKKGIPATLLGSAQKEDVMPQVENGHYRIVFTTPETFYETVTQVPKEPFLKMARDGKLSVVAVDEAHLISSWQSFR